jgi:hypothetical protein
VFAVASPAGLRNPDKPQVYGPGDGLNAGYRAERPHSVIDMPIDATFRNVKNLTNFK